MAGWPKLPFRWGRRIPTMQSMKVKVTNYVYPRMREIDWPKLSLLYGISTLAGWKLYEGKNNVFESCSNKLTHEANHVLSDDTKMSESVAKMIDVAHESIQNQIDREEVSESLLDIISTVIVGDSVTRKVSSKLCEIVQEEEMVKKVGEKLANAAVRGISSEKTNVKIIDKMLKKLELARAPLLDTLSRRLEDAPAILETTMSSGDARHSLSEKIVHHAQDVLEQQTFREKAAEYVWKKLWNDKNPPLEPMPFGPIPQSVSYACDEASNIPRYESDQSSKHLLKGDEKAFEVLYHGEPLVYLFFKNERGA